jgi:hypothetical protein
VASLAQQETPNKACSGWWGFCGFEKHFSGFGFFLLSNRIPARPTTTNAHRWVAEPKSKCKTIFDSQGCLCDWLRNPNPFLAVALFQVNGLGQYFFSKQVCKFSAFLLAAVSSLT